ncbi:diacylglycerol/lipid kinase family protein [Arenimonas terrae]|uniref:Diacylglycerol kinase n=1 Tax=Arenimonas terrae TaxID=2546226 RepID=A0A5C4RWD1_9GAMM|nr:diacylglycerol kinase family protein [Arenimonas terrae]TNJ35131.1 diacylglycerol kinase [Arenimonas terrae]
MTSSTPLSPRAPFFVVINAGSGRDDADEAIPTIRSILEASGREFDVLEVADPARLPERIAEALERARRAGGVVVAAGGDGTINAAAQQLIGSDVPLGVLPQGTFNYFGREHGISQDVAESTRSLLRASAVPVQVGRVNGRVFLVNASLGLYPKLLEDREAFKQQFGRSRMAAAWSGLRTLLGERRQLQLEIESEGKRRTVRTPTLFVGNNRLQLERIGIAEAAMLENGCLAGVMLRPIGDLAMLGLALRGAFGRLGEAETVETFAMKRITVTPRGKRRVRVALDGEVLRMAPPIVFDVAPEPLLLMLPAPEDRVEVE